MKLVLEVLQGPHAGARFTFDRHDTFVVGRDRTCHLILDEDKHFSRHHFLLEFNPPKCYLRDLDSLNGTVVNGVRVKEAFLKDGDVVGGGKTKLRLSLQLEETVRVDVRCLSCGSKGGPETISYHAVPGQTCSYVCQTCRPLIEQQPQPVPGYEIVRKLGKGGMGAVYLGRKIATAQTVAIKLILPEAVAGERAVQFFLREVSVLSKLDHPRIVRFYEIGVAQGQFFFAMEYVATVDLKELLAPLALAPRIRTICGIMCQVLEALHHAHEQGFVHRDIKPPNILVTRLGQKLRTKLADFGLAKNFENGGFSGMTRSGEVRGSLPFMAPEQIIDCQLSKPTVDIYGVGATLYHLLTNAMPHDFSIKKDPYAIVLDDPIVPLNQRCPEAPADLVALVHRALAKDPRERFAAAQEMRAALLPFAKANPKSENRDPKQARNPKSE